MTTKKLSIEEYRVRISEGEVTDPLVFLESIQSGQDPRRVSELYELVHEIQTMTDGKPSPEDWLEVLDLVVTHFRYKGVSVVESINAAKTIAEYLHPKRKQVEMSVGGSGEHLGARKITKEEVELVDEVFNAEF